MDREVHRREGMPSSESILAGLSALAERWIVVAYVWHAVIGVALIAGAAGWRPDRRATGAMLTLPLFSASALAWGGGNPFNGIVLGGFALVLLVLSTRLQRGPVDGGPPWAIVVGAFAIAFAWVYPHFVPSEARWTFLGAAPVGIIPCPSFAVVLGGTLLARGCGSGRFAIVAGVGGLFYALFGIFRLGVLLDVGLLLAAIATLTLGVRRTDLEPRWATRRVHALESVVQHR